VPPSLSFFHFLSRARRFCFGSYPELPHRKKPRLTFTLPTSLLAICFFLFQGNGGKGTGTFQPAPRRKRMALLSTLCVRFLLPISLTRLKERRRLPPFVQFCRRLVALVSLLFSSACTYRPGRWFLIFFFGGGNAKPPFLLP